MALLNVHNAVGALLVLLSLVAIFWAPARRYVLFLLVIQIVLGASLWWSTKLVPPLAHWVLAFLNGGTYAMATAFERRGRSRALVLGAVILGALVFVVIAVLGTLAAPRA